MPQDFLAAWQRYRDGVEPLDQLTRTLRDALDRDIRAATAVQRFVLSARDNGELDEAGFDGLMEAIDRILTEDVPTEYSLDAGTGPAAAVLPRGDAASTFEPPQPGAVLKDRYCIEELVAASPCHRVFRATDQSPVHGDTGSGQVALKVVSAASPADSPLVAALRREAHIGRRLTHANVVRSYDLDQDGHHTFLCLEWLEGESLARILDARRNRPMPRVQALQLIEGICRGLAAAHAQGVIHADLKPGNIFITRDGRVKLLDFGAARIADDTRPPALRGFTPEYASCEVLEGADPEAADDLYSAALVAYRMLAGERAFGPRTALEAEVEGLAPARIENLTPSQWRALSRALAFRRNGRQASVTEFLADLKGPRDDGPGHRDLANAHAAVAEKPGRGRPWRLAAGAVAIALAGIALGLKLGSTPSAGPATPAAAAAAGTAAPPATPLPVAAPVAAPAPPSGTPVVSAAGRPLPADRKPATRPRADLSAGPSPVAPEPPVGAAAAGTEPVAPDQAVAQPLPAAALMTAAFRDGPPATSGQASPGGARADAADPPDSPPGGGAPDTATGDGPVPFSSLKLRRYVEPRYPSLSAVRGEPGWVDVQFTVDGEGKPGNLQVLGAEPAGRFEQAALAAVRRWRFERAAGSSQVVTQIRVRFAPE